jgi:hypothetical protein
MGGGTLRKDFVILTITGTVVAFFIIGAVVGFIIGGYIGWRVGLFSAVSALKDKYKIVEK